MRCTEHLGGGPTGRAPATHSGEALTPPAEPPPPPSPLLLLPPALPPPAAPPPDWNARHTGAKTHTGMDACAGERQEAAATLRSQIALQGNSGGSGTSGQRLVRQTATKPGTQNGPPPAVWGADGGPRRGRRRQYGAECSTRTSNSSRYRQQRQPLAGRWQQPRAVAVN